MNFLNEELENYVDRHTEAEPAHLAALAHETWQKVIMPRMLSGHFQGRMLSLISKMIQPQRILEIGTYTGYSALCLAEGLKPGGKLITIDINDELNWIHKKHITESSFGQNIDIRYGDAKVIIPQLDESFDLVFIDADKENYLIYFDLLIEKLRPGAVLLADNVLWSGKVLYEAHRSDVETQVLQAFNQKITEDARVENVLLPIRDGLMMIRKRT